MSDEIRCPECGSSNVDCAEKPIHQHRCFDCGHATPPLLRFGLGRIGNDPAYAADPVDPSACEGATPPETRGEG